VANQIKMMNGTALKAYLDVNSVVVTGIDRNSLYRGNGLPEGNYTVCLQVLDYRTGAPLSQPAPTGCSAPIQIQQITPRNSSLRFARKPLWSKPAAEYGFYLATGTRKTGYAIPIQDCRASYPLPETPTKR
jgi:hypothetical protein